jgi:hypothetical protein
MVDSGVSSLQPDNFCFPHQLDSRSLPVASRGAELTPGSLRNWGVQRLTKLPHERRGYENFIREGSFRRLLGRNCGVELLRVCEMSDRSCRHILMVHLAFDPEPGWELQSLAHQASHFLLAVSIRHSPPRQPRTSSPYPVMRGFA